MSWSAHFRQPIRVPGGRSIKNLNEARAYVLRLRPEAIHTYIWEIALSNLLNAGETDDAGWTEAARIALQQAIRAPSSRIPKTPSKVARGIRERADNAP